MKPLGLFSILLLAGLQATAQSAKKPVMNNTQADTTSYLYQVPDLAPTDTIPSITLRDVDIVYFKTKEEWMMYYKYKSRIEIVLPYVKIAKQLYEELEQEKSSVKRRQYRSYRKDVEKEMRTRFEKELKNLNTGQGEMLFKLINRETGNNAYSIIKEIKGGATAWFYQLVGKKWGYDLKEKYDPQKEKMIELIIRQMGPAYNI